MEEKKYFDNMDKKEALKQLVELLDLRDNPYHPLAFINGEPEMGKDVFVGFLSEINAKGARVMIGDRCDIASFVSINVADSHARAIGLSDTIHREDIVLEHDVFVGSHCFIGGGCHIGHHSVVAAGTILVHGGEIPPYSLIKGNPAEVFPGYYANKLKNK